MAESFTLTVDADELAASLLDINGLKNHGQMLQMFGADPEDVLEIAIQVVNALHSVLVDVIGEENFERVIELQELVLESQE